MNLWSYKLVEAYAINSKAGKTAALPKFSDMLTLYQPGGVGELCPPIGFACLKCPDYALVQPYYAEDVNK